MGRLEHVPHPGSIQAQERIDTLTEANNGVFWSSMLQAVPLDEVGVAARGIRRAEDKVMLPASVGHLLMEQVWRGWGPVMERAGDAAEVMGGVPLVDRGCCGSHTHACGTPALPFPPYIHEARANIQSHGVMSGRSA